MEENKVEQLDNKENKNDKLKNVGLITAAAVVGVIGTSIIAAKAIPNIINEVEQVICDQTGMSIDINHDGFTPESERLYAMYGPGIFNNEDDDTALTESVEGYR